MLGQGAIVLLLITDGLERDEDPVLSSPRPRSLHPASWPASLIWLNPLLRFDDFEPKAEGVSQLLPHVDEHRPVHNLQSLASLAEALAR